MAGILYDKSIVSSGNSLVSEAAATILKQGGNAFDAVVAAGFASSVVEHGLTSLGGGGFLLGHSARHNQNLFFDFFVETPGLGEKNPLSDPHFFPVSVQFSGALQEFHVGLGSVAVPGVAKGLLHIHERLGYMDLAEVILPAVSLAKNHRINTIQSHFLNLLVPIMTLSPTGRQLFGDKENYVKVGDRVKNEALANFIQHLAEDKGESFYRGEIAHAIVKDMSEQHGLVTAEDLAQYRVIERKPLKMSFRDTHFFTAPPPSVGGSLIGLSLSLWEKAGKPEYEWGSGKHLKQTLNIMKEVESLRKQGIISPEKYSSSDESNISSFDEGMRLCSRGTTHISISDKEGNCASMTCSNGEGSGYFAPKTGVMLNNMMGEDDLHPGGFHTSPAGQRVGSMMSPSMLMRNNRVELVAGSGGSKRIRSAITQVLSQVVDFDRSLTLAVAAPRLYLDEDCLQAEPGFDSNALSALGVDVNIWDKLDVYFGGVHAVIPGREGAGDSRRGGSVVIV